MARGRVRTPRRRKQWASLLGLTDLSVPAAAQTQGASGGLSFNEPATIMRVMGSLRLGFDQVNDAIAAGDVFSATFGLCILPTDTFTLGPTAWPDPSAEPEYPWLLWKSLGIIAQQAETAGMFIDLGGMFQHWEFDSRVRRKIEPGETLCWVVESAAITGSCLAYFNMEQNRVLLALP